MIIGFTGTQRGMTSAQLEVFKSIIEGLQPDAFHHGDCIGSDAQAHEIVKSLGVQIAIHPPDNPIKRAWCEGFIYNPAPYLERNRHIVDCVDLLIATPETFEEVLRSGTWATIRYARKRGKPVKVINPNGGIV